MRQIRTTATRDLGSRHSVGIDKPKTTGEHHPSYVIKPKVLKLFAVSVAGELLEPITIRLAMAGDFLTQRAVKHDFLTQLR